MKRSVGYAVVFSILCLGTVFADQEPTDSGCTRGQPEPLFVSSNSAVLAHSFKENSSTEAIEEVTFVSGDKLTIKNGGCEYYTLSFRYESDGIVSHEESPEVWFTKAAEALERLGKLHLHSVFNEQLAAKKLRRMLKKKETFKLGEQIPVEGDGEEFLQTQVVVKGGGQLKKISRGYVEFDLMKGPL